MNEEILQRLKRSLEREIPYFSGTEPVIAHLPEKGAKSAVLILFAFDAQKLPWILLTQRTETVSQHKGQIAFPGGRVEPDEEQNEGLTALREAEEEVGLKSSSIELIGKMKPFPTLSSGFFIHPFVGVHQERVQEVTLIPDPRETASAFWVPWSFFTEKKGYAWEPFRNHHTHVFYYEDKRIWGATAFLLKNLLDRFESVK